MMPPDQLLAAYRDAEAKRAALEREVATLRAQIAWLQQKLFGTGRSEKVDRAQLLLGLNELEKPSAEPEPAQPQKITYERQPAKPRRDPAEAFAKLPVQETVVVEPEEVKARPEAFEKIGEERSFEVDITPPRLFKREIVRPKYRRKAEPSCPPLVAPAPARVASGGYASAGLIAWVVTAKYDDHAPLFRQEQQFARWGVEISRQTMMEWISLAARTTEPLYKRILHNLRQSGYVQVDETPIHYHDPTVPKGKTEQGYFWSLSAPKGDIVLQWQQNRRHAGLVELIGENYRGVLQADGYEAYAAYAREREGVTWVACWAHARRKFYEAREEAPVQADFVLELIGSLYADERRWDESGVSAEERASLRKAEWTPRLNWLKRAASGLRQEVLPKSRLGLACQYLLNQWDALVAHLEHGCTRIDNNGAENTIRPAKLGMKNWLFIGHPEAGQRSAILYSLVLSCKRHGKDPFAYLRDVLTRLPAMTNQDDLTPLLPSNWTPPTTPKPAASFA